MKHTAAVLTLLLAGILGSAVPLHAESYTLDQYLRQVEKNAKELLLARQDIDQAELGVRQAKSALFPSVFAQAGYTRNFLELPQPYPSNEYFAGVSASQALLNLKAYHALKFGEEYTALQRTVYEETLRSILTSAKKLYYQAVLLRENLIVKQASENGDYATYQNVKRKYEAGVIQELEVLRAEVVWRTKIAETAQARKNLAVLLLGMKSLAGIPRDEEFVPTDTFTRVPPLPPEADPAKVLAARSDYELLLRQKRMAEITIDLARADYYPTVSAELTYGYTSMSDGFRLGGGTDVLQLGVRISLPVYTGGARSTGMDIERSSLEKKRIEIAAMQDRILTETRQIFLSLVEAKDRIDTAGAVLQTAERAYALALLSQQNGLITQLELNESAVQLEGARLGLNAAVYDYLSSYFDWEKATGEL